MRAILTYHSIDDSGSPISLAPDVLARHVAWMASGAVRVVPLAGLRAVPPGEDALAVTFDDGFANLARAWPLLRERGLPASVFVVTDLVGRTNAWEEGKKDGLPVLPLLGWEELGRLAEEGLTIGAHGRRHVSLAGLSAGELTDEVQGSRERLVGELGLDPREFAYPFGDQDPAAVAEVRRGFDRACTTELRALQPSDHPLLLPRLDAFYLRAPGLLEAWGTRRFRAWVLLRAGARNVRGFVRALASRRGGPP